MRAEFNNRIALALLPIVLLWLRWCAIEHARARDTSALPAPVVAVIAIVVFGVSFVSGMAARLEWGLPRGSGAWLPIAMFSVWVLSRPLRMRLPRLDHIVERARAHWHASRCP